MHAKNIPHALRVSAFSPTWLPSPWNQPWVGYIFAVCLPAAMIVLTWFLLQFFPTFAFKGLFALASTLLIALLWGTGPGVLATLLSAILLNVVLLSPVYRPHISLVQTLLETGTFVAFGLTICLVVSRIEYARSEAERAQQRSEEVARQLEQEKQQMQALLEAVPDAITVFDRKGGIAQMNKSAQRLLPRFMNQTQASVHERLLHLEVQNTDGSAMTESTSVSARLLQGETLTGAQAQDVIVKTFDGEQLWLNVAGAPLYDKQGHVNGAVAVIRDQTSQHESSQRTWKALHALLHFAQALVRPGTTQQLQTTEAGQQKHEVDTRIDQVANRLAVLMGQVLGYRQVSLTAFREGTREPEARANVGLQPDQEQGWRERRPGYTLFPLIIGTPLESRLNAGESAVIDLSQPPFTVLLDTYGPARLLLVPMCLEDRLVGIVTFNAGEPEHDYSDEELALARALAQLAALTLERTRLFQQRTQAEATVLALSETNRLMDEFIGMAGHELRTPVTTIQASVQLARRQVNKISQAWGWFTRGSHSTAGIGWYSSRAHRAADPHAEPPH